MDTSSEGVRKNVSQSVQRVILIEGLANVFVLVLKVIVGLTTGSLAVLGDAIHSLSDAANNVVAWFVIRLSNEPADREHPYGHRKFETLAVFGLAGLLTVLGFELILRALQRESSEVVSSDWGLALMALHRDELDEATVTETVGCIFKYHDDIERFTTDNLVAVLDQVDINRSL